MRRLCSPQRILSTQRHRNKDWIKGTGCASARTRPREQLGDAPAEPFWSGLSGFVRVSNSGENLIMAFLRVLVAIALVLAGAFLPAAGADPATPPAHAIGMVHEYFSTDHVTIHRGEKVEMVNSSRWIHIVGPGKDGSLEEANGLPMHERVLMETDDTYTTAQWNEPGVYFLTCSIHPLMNVEVTVTN